MKQSKSKGEKPSSWWRGRIAIGTAMVMLLLFSGTAFAAEIMSGDPYILPRGEVVKDDLYVTGSEVIIDGTVEGDVVVAAGYVEINGVVMGDLLAAGGSVIVTGNVQDDVRAAGGAVILSGRVGDDFFAAAGGGWPGVMMVPIGSTQSQWRSAPQGLQINAGSSIGGDAIVAGGQGSIAGSIGSNLAAGMSSLTFSGKVAGDANLSAQNLTVLEGAVVQGELSYSSDGETVVPEGVAVSVVQRPSSQDTSVTSASNPDLGLLSLAIAHGACVDGVFIGGLVALVLCATPNHGPCGRDGSTPNGSGNYRLVGGGSRGARRCRVDRFGCALLGLVPWRRDHVDLYLGPSCPCLASKSGHHWAVVRAQIGSDDWCGRWRVATPVSGNCGYRIGRTTAHCDSVCW